MWTLRLVRAAGVFKRESRTLWLSSGHHSWWQPYCNGKSHGSLQQNGNSKERWKSGSRGGRARYGVGGLLAATVVRPDGQDEIDGSVDHFEVVDGLVRETLTCATCRLRLPVDRKIDGTPYCSCPKGGRAPAADVAGWKPFIERPGTLVWRRQHHTLKGLFAYKMYGRLDEITALDFLRVQLDTTYRRRWDPSAAQLEVVDEDEESATDIVYWETHWPKPFSNRDYVFERRIDVDAERRLCVLSSAATNHAARPARRSMHRVTEYWSHMVVRPLGDWNQPGVEFVLTYFDNPGLSIPSSVSTWVAMTALPNFVVKLNEAALHVGERGGSQPALMKRVHAELEQWRQLQLEQQREQSLLESVGEQVGDWGPEETDPSSESRGKIAQSPPRFSIKWPVLHLTSCPSDATKKTQSSCSVLSQKM